MIILESIEQYPAFVDEMISQGDTTVLGVLADWLDEGDLISPAFPIFLRHSLEILHGSAGNVIECARAMIQFKDDLAEGGSPRLNYDDIVINSSIQVAEFIQDAMKSALVGRRYTRPWVSENLSNEEG